MRPLLADLAMLAFEAFYKTAETSNTVHEIRSNFDGVIKPDHMMPTTCCRNVDKLNCKPIIATLDKLNSTD